MTSAYPTSTSQNVVPNSEIASPVFASGLAKPVESIEYRSEMIAKAAARTHSIPQEVLHFLRDSRLPGKSDSLGELLTELIRSGSVHEQHARGSDLQRAGEHGNGLAHTIRWIDRSKNWMSQSVANSLILKSLMPIYLAAGQGKVGTSWSDTLTMCRMACIFLELDRLTEDHELAEWVKSNPPTQDPFDAIRDAFRIHIPKMSEAFWSEVQKTSGQSSPSPSTTHKRDAFDKQQTGWWTLVCQFRDQKSQITIPPNLGLGMIDWSKLLDHWHRVTELLDASHDSKRSGPTEFSQPSKSSPSHAPEKPHLNDRRFVEIRSAKDPQLSKSLDHLLMQSRNEQGLLSLIVVKRLDNEVSSNQILSLQNWQSNFIQLIDKNAESANVRGFISDDGDLTLVYQDVERSALARWIREAFTNLGQSMAVKSLATTQMLPLVAGIASVNAPSRSFTIDQLIQAAWRCLDGAKTQGAGAVKTIEVY